MENFLSNETELKLPKLFCALEEEEEKEEEEKNGYKLLVGMKQIKKNFVKNLKKFENVSLEIERELIDLKVREEKKERKKVN